MNHKDTKTEREPIPLEVDRVSREVVDAIYSVHSTLGPGLLESVYEVCLARELAQRGLKVDRQVTLPVHYGGVRLEAGLRLDLLIFRHLSLKDLVSFHVHQLNCVIRFGYYLSNSLFNYRNFNSR